MKIIQFIISYLKPFVIWAIIFSILLQFTWNQEIFNLVTWILESQIYLVIFFTSFAHAYFQQMLPIITTWRQIREKQRHDREIIPRVMINRFVMNVALWLSGVLFFSGLLMSFGVLYPESIPDIEEYNKTRTVLQITGIGLFVPALYYSKEFERLLKKYEIKFDKEENFRILISVVSLVFFISLSYVAIICFSIMSS